MKFDYYSFDVAGVFAPALINGDLSGLTDSEEKDFEAFLANAPAEIEHWGCDGEAENFTVCEVCGMHAMCIEVKGYFRATR